MKTTIVILLFLAILKADFVFGQTNELLTNTQKSWVAKANRHEKNGWTYLHIEGTPQERGFQHGYLMSGEIKEAIRVLSIKWTHQTALDWKWYVQKTGEIFTHKVDPENLAEIDGIVEGMSSAGVPTSRDEIVGLNGYVELMGDWWSSVKDSIKSFAPPYPKESCSSFIATGSMTIDGKIVLGHNTMDGYFNPQCNIILDILPEKGHRILMQSISGFIHSETDFFITDAGLVGSETTIGDFKSFDIKGDPEFTRMRHATQYASNIEEWCEMMKKNNNGGYANAWLIGDINTNEIARLELGLKFIGYEKKKDGFFIGSNVAEDLKILRFETGRDETNIKLSSIARRVRWKQLMKENVGKIDIKLAQVFEADHYDSYRKKKIPGSRSLCGHWELDPQYDGVYVPFNPEGTVDGKVVDAEMARNMSFLAKWGSSCGIAFNAKKFLEEHPQFYWMDGLLVDRPTQPWTIFKSGEGN